KHLRVGEAITHVDIREEVDRAGWIVFNFLAQLADESAQILHLFAAIRAPDRREKTSVGDHSAGAAHQTIKDVVFLACKMHGLAALGDTATRRRETDFAYFDWCVFHPGGRMDAAVRGANARDELANAERLGDVVVCTEFKRFNLFFLAVQDRHHEHGQPGCEGADAPERLNPAD